MIVNVRVLSNFSKRRNVMTKVQRIRPGMLTRMMMIKLCWRRCALLCRRPQSVDLTPLDKKADVLLKNSKLVFLPLFVQVALKNI